LQKEACAMLTHRVRLITQLLLPLLIGLGGCQNHNLFSKLHGDSSSPATLTSEASIALRNKDFSKALELSNRVLGDDPNNADALYYAAAAKLGLAGFNLGAMVSNVLSQVGSSALPVSNFSDLVQRGRDGVSAQGACGGVSSLISGLDCDALNNALTDVISNLHIIAAGQAHGTIQKNDTAMLFDLGVMYALRAAVRSAIGGFLDLTNVNGDFGVVAGPHLSTLCTDHADEAINIVKDVASSYSAFNRILSVTDLKDDSLVQNVRDEINVAGEKLLDDGSGRVLPQECFDNVFDNYTPPLTQANYRTVFADAPFN
jgi:hypothetical protein